MARHEDKKEVATAFRKIDVDLYNENNFKEEETVDGVAGQSGPDETEVLGLLSQYPFYIENNFHSLIFRFLFTC